MMRRMLLPIAACLALGAATGLPPTAPPAAAQAQAAASVTAGDLEISHFRAKAMLPGQPVGGGYLSIANRGTAADRLVNVTSPNAGKVEIHIMEIVNDVMTMRPVEGGLEIPAGATVELKPGGAHLMFMAVSEPFRQGATVPVTLEFEKAGKVDLVLPIESLGDD
jgi:copper(I)-binding protein